MEKLSCLFDVCMKQQFFLIGDNNNGGSFAIAVAVEMCIYFATLEFFDVVLSHCILIFSSLTGQRFDEYILADLPRGSD